MTTTKWKRPPKAKPKYPFVVVLTCAHCGRRFGWKTNGPNETPATYCRNHPSTTDKPQKTPCPSPGKIAYATQREAIRGAIVTSGDVAKPMRTYRCACGKYHVTSRTSYRKVATINVSS